jgi:hypothetical protein
MNYLADEKVFTDDFVSGLPTEGVLAANCPGGYNGAVFESQITNDVTGMTAYLNSNYPAWKVCDGSEYSDLESPIWSTSGRYLPSLTDGRIIRGASAVGGSGGANEQTITNSTLPAHNHSYNYAVGNGGHNHSGYANNSNEIHDHACLYWNVAGNSLTIDRNIGVNRASQSSFPNLTLGNNRNAQLGHNHVTNSVNQNHSHNLSVNFGNTGGNSPLSVLPAYTNYFFTVRVK